MLHYRPMHAHEADAVCHLAAKVFCTFVAPLYTPEGVVEFLQYLKPQELWKRLHHEHFVLVAEEAGHLVGMIEIFDNHHVSLLFVDEAQQGRGVGRHLLEAAIKQCHQVNSQLVEVTVHATPNAVPIYAHLGFHAVAAEQTKQGIRYTPMARSLTETAGQHQDSHAQTALH